MATSETMMVLADDCRNLEDLQKFLNAQETVFEREIIDFGLAQGATRFNVFDYNISAGAKELPRLSVFEIPQVNADSTLRNLLRSHTAIAYTPALINNKEKKILVARNGATLKIVGKMSTFGGPQDTGMTGTEGLALIQPAHFDEFREYFIPGTTLPRGRALNPDKFYIACRWDRNLTPYSWLRRIKVMVGNPLTGKSEFAQPMDWGPAAWTSRVADLSPGLSKALGLTTDEVCEVTIPLPTQSATAGAVVTGRNSQHEALIRIANRQFNLYHGVDESDNPLRDQIERYWTEIGEAFPGVGVPWSAVFISWCVMQAGATSADFKFDPKHAVYVKDAIAKAQSGTGTFRAFPVDKYAPRIGDLVHSNREGGTKTYNQAAIQNSYPSHCAIVVGFGGGSAGRFALTIGGNEGDSVRQAEVPVDENGFVRQRSRNPYICVIRTFDGGPNP